MQQSDEYSGLNDEDIKVLKDKIASGELKKGDYEIDDTLVGFDSDMFPDLKQDKEGDRVVVVMCGEVKSEDKEGVVVEFKSASVVHGAMSMRPGGGGRFAKLEAQLAKKPGVYNPGGLTAWLGRRKWGNAKMAKWSAAGRKG